MQKNGLNNLKNKTMKNIHILQTDRPSGLFRDIKGNLGFNTEWTRLPLGRKNQHIYITSSEKIKEGDWFINTSLNKPYQADASDVHVSLINEKKYCKKIILTDNKDLIKDGIQSIDDEFLEWFVKNPNCEWVEVEEVYFHGSGYYKASDLSEKEKERHKFMREHKIIIPKEEPKMIECYFFPSKVTSSATICANCGKEKFLHTIGEGIKVSKSIIITQGETKQNRTCTNNCSVVCGECQIFEQKQEAIEEAAQKQWGNVHRTGVLGFIEGANWQAERMYSEEDMVEFSKWRIIYEDENPNNVKHSKKLLKEWFEQHKKK